MTWVLNGLGDVGGEVDDDLAVDGEVVIGLFEFLGEHLCIARTLTKGIEGMRRRQKDEEGIKP